jgi:hypothetical protein
MNEHEHKIDIAVVVNGHPVPFDKINVKTVLRELVERALKESGNSGQPIDNWELRDAGGQILELHRTLAHYGITNGAQLFLSLKAGVGG